MDNSTARGSAVNRLEGRVLTWLSNPANIILLVFFVLLTVLTLYPLLSLLTEMFTVHLGREARLAKLAAGERTLFHFQRLFFTAENSYSEITFYRPFLNTLVVSVASSVTFSV